MHQHEQKQNFIGFKWPVPKFKVPKFQKTCLQHD